MNQTRVSRGAACGHVAWAQRTYGHPRVAAALAAGDISASYGRLICGWTGTLAEQARDEADKILVAAARSGLDQRGLNGLGAAMYEESRKGAPDDDPGLVSGDRPVQLETTIGGAGVLAGELTPQCAAFISTVLEALSAPAGAQDTRSHGQRYHDALEEAMRPLCFCVMMVHGQRTGRPGESPVQDGRVRPSERDR